MLKLAINLKKKFSFNYLNSRWKHVEQEEFDWGGLERSRPSTSQHTRSTSCSSAPSIRNAIPTPKPSVPHSTPSRFSHRASARQFSSFKNNTIKPLIPFLYPTCSSIGSRRTEVEEGNRRPKSRSRRLQSTTA